MSTVLLSLVLLGVGGLVGLWLARRRASKRHKSTDTTTAAPPTKPHRMSLLLLVVIGTIAVTIVGIMLFAWLAWLLSRQPAPWHDPNGWAAFISQVDGAKIFDAARITATLLAIVGIGGAALVAYRRQDTAEQSHQVAIQAQDTAGSSTRWTQTNTSWIESAMNSKRIGGPTIASGSYGLDSRRSQNN